MTDAFIIVISMAATSVVLSTYALWVWRGIKADINNINKGHAALNECQMALLDKMKYIDDFCYTLSDRTIRTDNQLRSLKRLADIEDAKHLAQHMKDESKRYADLAKAYQAKVKNLKNEVNH